MCYAYSRTSWDSKYALHKSSYWVNRKSLVSSCMSAVTLQNSLCPHVHAWGCIYAYEAAYIADNMLTCLLRILHNQAPVRLCERKMLVGRDWRIWLWRWFWNRMHVILTARCSLLRNTLWSLEKHWVHCPAKTTYNPRWCYGGILWASSLLEQLLSVKETSMILPLTSKSLPMLDLMQNSLICMQGALFLELWTSFCVISYIEEKLNLLLRTIHKSRQSKNVHCCEDAALEIWLALLAVHEVCSRSHFSYFRCSIDTPKLMWQAFVLESRINCTMWISSSNMLGLWSWQWKNVCEMCGCGPTTQINALCSTLHGCIYA